MLGAGSAGVRKMPDGAGKRTSKLEPRLLRFSVLLVLQLLGSLEPHSANSATLTVRSFDEICGERMAYASCASEEDLASGMLNSVRKRAGCSIV